MDYFKVISKIKSMPLLFKFMWGLNAVTYIPILFFGFLPWPDATYELNGQALTYSEFWLTGFAPIALIFTALMTYVSYATYKCFLWSKAANFIYWALLMLLLGYGTIVGLLVCSLFIISLWYYFFKSERVNLFYQGSNVE